MENHKLSDVTFSLRDEFLVKYKGKEPNWGVLGKVTYLRTYSKLRDDGTKEEFWQTLDRVVTSVFQIQKWHCLNHGITWNEENVMHVAERMYDKMWNFKFLPPGRGLWAMGSKSLYKYGSSALNNCAFISTKDLAENPTYPFCFLMDFSMLGVGVGFDTLGADTVKVLQPEGVNIHDNDFDYIVEDSREGWVNSLRQLLNAYFYKEGLPVFDYSQIRAKGQPLKTFGGVAPGPEPLKNMHISLNELLQSRIGQTLSSVDIVDIMNIIGKAVVSGGIRRSSQLVLGFPNDTNYVTMKQDKEKLYAFRWNANISVFATEGMNYTDLAKSTAINGEPGYVWLDKCRKYSRMIDPIDNKDRNAMGVNPCSEQVLESEELCCLVETFPSKHESPEEFYDTLKYALLYGKTVTLLPTHNKHTNTIMLKNRRLGISMSGIVQAIQKFGHDTFFKMCDTGYKNLRDLDKLYSGHFGVPESIKLCSVKPSGSISLLPGVTPGIHFPHSEYYIRRIRIQDSDPLLEQLQRQGVPIEKDKYSDNTMVVSFPVKEEFFNRSKNNVSMWEQLELAAQMQYYWSDNAVSITVTVNKNEADQIQHALPLYEKRLKAVSFLPLSEHGYEQAPYEEITKEQYDEMVQNITPIELKVNSEAIGEKFCSNDTCTL